MFVYYLIHKRTAPFAFISQTVLFAFVLALGKYALINYFFDPGYPNATFLFKPEDRFNDFMHMVNTCKNLDPYNLSNIWPSVYFPVSNLFFYLVYVGAGKHMTLAMIIFAAVFLLVFLYLVTRSQVFSSYQKAILFLVCLISYPMLFSLDRLNLELYVFLFVYLFVHFYAQKRMLPAVIFISLAISMKLYPAVFLVLFLKNRQFKAITSTALLTMAMTMGSLALFAGTMQSNVLLLWTVMNRFNDFLFSMNGLQHSVSMFGVFKIPLLAFCHFALGLNTGESHVFSNAFLRIPYLVFVVAYVSSIAWFIVRIERVFWKQVCLIVSIILLLPHISGDYKLLFILMAALLFLEGAMQEKNRLRYVALFALLLIPNGYFYLEDDVSIAVLINPLLILLLSISIVWESRSEIQRVLPWR